MVQRLLAMPSSPSLNFFCGGLALVFFFYKLRPCHASLSASILGPHVPPGYYIRRPGCAVCLMRNQMPDGGGRGPPFCTCYGGVRQMDPDLHQPF
jgi:hypothetical protein